MKKKLISTMLIVPLLLSTISYSAFAANESLKLQLQIGSKKVLINDTNTAQLLQSPFIKGDKTYVPIRFISERLKADVKWNQKSQQVTIVKDNKTIILTVNNKKVLVNGSTQYLESPALIVDGTTFVPLRFISENLNTIVTWNQQNRSITIQAKDGVTDNGSTTVTPIVKTEEEQIKEVLQKQIDYLNKEDASGLLSITHKPTETKEQLQAMFDSMDMEYSLDSVTNISIKGSEASALVSRDVKRYAVDFNKVVPEKYVEFHANILLDTTLVKTGGVWKVYRVTTKNMTNLTEKAKEQ